MQSSDPLPCSFVLKNTAHLLKKKKKKNGDHSQGPFFKFREMLTVQQM